MAFVSAPGREARALALSPDALPCARIYRTRKINVLWLGGRSPLREFDYVKCDDFVDPSVHLGLLGPYREKNHGWYRISAKLKIYEQGPAGQRCVRMALKRHKGIKKA